MLNDPAAERAVLSGILKFGAECYYDVADIVQNDTFTIDSNKNIYMSIKDIYDKDDTVKIDIPTILSTAKEIGLGGFFENRSEIDHLKAVISFPIKDLKNVRRLAAKIRKLQITRHLHDQLDSIQDNLLNVSGTESVAEILGIVEEPLFNFSSLVNDSDDGPQKIGSGLLDRLKELAENPIDHIGIPTNFPVWEKCVGGLRPASIHVVGARSKVGKSLISNSIANFVASNDLPVLYMDTEMRKEEQENRTAAMLTEIPINEIETGKFKNKEKVFEAVKSIENIPYYHRSIAGMPLEEQLAIMRRWLAKEVGLNEDGTAKPCLIIYDYIKLMDSDGLDKISEYQALGFLMTALHNFTVRYKIPMLALVQLNRDGLTKEGVEAVSGSDRIIWLCSSFSIFRFKSEEEIAIDGQKYGTHKLVPLVARFGPCLSYGDYINCNVKGWCAKVEEGLTKSELVNGKEEFKCTEPDKDIPFL